MRSLFWKGMLAFLAVILVAVGTVALLAGRATETELRRYALVQGEIWTHLISDLSDHYAARGSWEGAENILQAHRGRGQRNQQGAGRGSGPSFDFQIASAAGEIVASTSGSPGGIASQAELDRSISIDVGGETVGYLLPSSQALDTVPLDSSQSQFLTRVQQALWIATLAALAAAVIIGGLLFRSIVAPLHQLTAASLAISGGDLSAQAPVRGRDEVAQLAGTFNQMAQTLARTEEARKNQTADIAHELRTPLTVIQGTLEAMLDGIYPSDRETLEAALDQARVLARLVEDLRILALADAGQLRVHKETLDLEQLLRGLVEAHKPKSVERRVTVALDFPSAPPVVLADQDRLTQVVGNLLSNALRYLPQGGHLIVRVTDQDEGPLVAIVDDGPGVSPDDMSHLFERFWRADHLQRPAASGTGLGLAVSRRIVEAHGGHIWAEPTPGGGLTVAFTLPDEAPRGQPGEQAS